MCVSFCYDGSDVLVMIGGFSYGWCYPFSEPHECYCLELFMCPPLSSFELCFMIA